TGSWVCSFTHNGKRHVQKIQFARTRAEAEKGEAVIMADVFRQVYGLNGKEDCPFKQFVLDKFLPYSEANKRTFYDDVIVCKILIRFFKDRMMRSITPALVEEFKQKRLATPISRQKDRVAKNWTPSTRLKRARQKRSEESDEPPKPRKPATVKRELCVLSKIFSLAVDAELLDDNPCRRVKKLRTANQRVRYLTNAEEEARFKALRGQDWVKNIIVMAINTGMRRGELFDSEMVRRRFQSSHRARAAEQVRPS